MDVPAVTLSGNSFSRESDTNYSVQAKVMILLSKSYSVKSLVPGEASVMLLPLHSGSLQGENNGG